MHCTATPGIGTNTDLDVASLTLPPVAPSLHNRTAVPLHISLWRGRSVRPKLDDQPSPRKCTGVLRRSPATSRWSAPKSLADLSPEACTGTCSRAGALACSCKESRDIRGRATEKESRATCRIGIIGCGRIAQSVHLTILAGLPDARVVALAEPNPNVFDATRLQAPVSMGCLDYAKLLERPELDAVVICGPNAMHTAAAEAALERDKHINLEKHIATTLDDGRHLVATHRRSGIVGIVANVVILPTGIATVAFLTRRLRPSVFGLLFTMAATIRFIGSEIGAARATIVHFLTPYQCATRA